MKKYLQLLTDIRQKLHKGFALQHFCVQVRQIFICFWRQTLLAIAARPRHKSRVEFAACRHGFRIETSVSQTPQFLVHWCFCHFFGICLKQMQAIVDRLSHMVSFHLTFGRKANKNAAVLKSSNNALVDSYKLIPYIQKENMRSFHIYGV